MDAAERAEKGRPYVDVGFVGSRRGPTERGSVAWCWSVGGEVCRVEPGMVMGGDIAEGEEVIRHPCAVYGSLMGRGVEVYDEIHDVRGRRTGGEDGGTFESEAVSRDEGP